MNKIDLDLTKDYYTAKMIGKNITFQRILLVKNDESWKWHGVLHELISSSKLTDGAVLEGITGEYNAVLGFRSSQKDKWLKDVAILEEALEKEPENPRYRFYLAQTCLMTGDLEKAILNYQKRVDIPGKTCPDEVFWSLYTIGCLQSDLKKPHDVVIDSFLKAFAFDEKRREPLYRLAVQFQLMDSAILGYLVAKRALQIPKPTHALQIQHAVYDYLLELKYAELAWQIGKTQESFEQYKKLSGRPKIPEKTQLIIEQNIESLSKAFL